MNHKSLLSLATGLGLFFFSVYSGAAPSGKEIAQKGNGKGALACMTCHGNQGQGNTAAGYPYLAGLPSDYLVKQLRDFRGAHRQNAVMKPFASALSEDEMRAVAKYYASLPAPAGNSKKTQDDFSRGEKIATQGKWNIGMPACFKCHGDNGQGVPPNFPPIAGQAASYIKTQLMNWREGKRSNDPAGLMRAVVKRLSDTEIAAVANYLATRSPARKP